MGKSTGLLILIVFSTWMNSFSQRFESDQYEVLKVTHNYADTLLMDVYIPKNDPHISRPVMLYVHGGGFYAGRRDFKSQVEFCEYFARKGWVTVAISYHLTMKGQSFGCNQPADNKMNTFREAAKNIHQSTLFLINHADEFGISPQKIILAGSSAGAEAVLAAAYWNETRNGILPENFKYSGLISMAGALPEINWITLENAIPTQLFHGTCDNLVPYRYASHHYCSENKAGYLPLYGSFDIKKRLEALNVSSYLVSDCGGGHEWAGKPMEDAYIEHVHRFLKSLMNPFGRMNERISLAVGTRSCDRLQIKCEDLGR
ncbi:MAG: alpha/beta hydrolase [Cyclobacteriaceae bacterium]|nr:alpha/beta hydrolase [Cyclobacteriaceae bacterium]